MDETIEHGPDPRHRHLIDRVPVETIADDYDRRGLDRLSDQELVAAVTTVVAEPREDPADSFVLHSPLELTARARLLERTPPELRRLARLRMVSIGARYQTYPAASLPVGPGPTGVDGEAGAEEIAGEVITALAAGDLAGVDRAVRHLGIGAGIGAGRPDRVERLLGRLAPAVATRTAAAAHAPIFLATLAEEPERAGRWLSLLRPLTRELARHPEWVLRWIGRSTPFNPGAQWDRAPDVEAIVRVLADPPHLGVPGSTFIHPLLMQVDEPGVADHLLGSVAGPGVAATTEAARAVLRVAALSMVRDDPARAPYGWTHCLTLPQAVLTIGPHLEAAGVPALAIAASHVLAFRVATATEALDPEDPLIAPADPTTAPNRRQALVAEAARRHDAHIAKYVLAVLTAADADPEAGELYLSAGQHLLAVWDDLGPDPDEVLEVD